ncbi:hypothetical protein Hrubri_4560 [Herbaspirillum rubrisubalbicans M1]|uniref:hypothetical protein n=1 Tax=Herbaspirillum rubrisubalbicans TaxID=80842 RepID=UPI000739FD34|nr:hypothetical protein [Herbaspirillum rubrisubalbicans]ALU91705.1 hypothetical protein Hrubri_4560 [Herbaspirillum rubrisubalbicans M1]
MKPPLLPRLSLFLALVSALLAGPAPAQSIIRFSPSTVSVVISVGLPALFISQTGRYVVKGVEASADGTVYVLEKLGEGVRGSVTVGTNVSGAASIGVGESVSFVTTTSGTLLVAAGKVLAIIPNALGEALLKNVKLS